MFHKVHELSLIIDDRLRDNIRIDKDQQQLLCRPLPFAH